MLPILRSALLRGEEIKNVPLQNFGRKYQTSGHPIAHATFYYRLSL
jgi:hypothetical protein